MIIYITQINSAGQEDIMRLLLENGANPEIKNHAGNSAKHFGAQYGIFFYLDGERKTFLFDQCRIPNWTEA